MISTDNFLVSIVAFIIMLICIRIWMKFASIIGERLGVSKFFFAIFRKCKDMLSNKKCSK